jgi:hypothetical protein
MPAWQIFVIEQYEKFIGSWDDLDVTKIAAICTISWILYQFIERRRLSEANIDRFLGQHFTDKVKAVEEQRRAYLEHFTQAQLWLPFRAAMVMCWSNVKRLVWFLVRIARLRFNFRSAPHAMLLFESGNRDDAVNLEPSR